MLTQAQWAVPRRLALTLALCPVLRTPPLPSTPSTHLVCRGLVEGRRLGQRLREGAQRGRHIGQPLRLDGRHACRCGSAGELRVKLTLQQRRRTPGQMTMQMQGSAYQCPTLPPRPTASLQPPHNQHSLIDPVASAAATAKRPIAMTKSTPYPPCKAAWRCGSARRTPQTRGRWSAGWSWGAGTRPHPGLPPQSSAPPETSCPVEQGQEG